MPHGTSRPFAGYGSKVHTMFQHSTGNKREKSKRIEDRPRGGLGHFEVRDSRSSVSLMSRRNILTENWLLDHSLSLSLPQKPQDSSAFSSFYSLCLLEGHM